MTKQQTDLQSEVRGLDFKLQFAPVDHMAFQSASEEEAKAVLANANTRIKMKIDDSPREDLSTEED